MLALSITGMTVSNMPSIVTNGTAVSVEAASKKKDKKKPKITFKGKTKLTAYKNKSIKIPKTTAKDNKDGYVITYTVTDKEGNKATKKRYVTVKNQPKKTTPETPTDNTPADYKNYDITTVTYNNNTYKICRDEDFATEITAASSNSTQITFNIQNSYLALYMDRSSKYFTNSEYIKLFGKITATDAEGNDISDSIVVYDVDLNNVKDIAYFYGSVRIYAENANGNKAIKSLVIYYCDFSKNYSESDYIAAGLTKISNDPIVFGQLPVQTTTLSQVSAPAKKLEHK